MVLCSPSDERRNRKCLEISHVPSQASQLIALLRTKPHFLRIMKSSLKSNHLVLRRMKVFSMMNFTVFDANIKCADRVNKNGRLMIVSEEAVRRAESRSRKNQSERWDLSPDSFKIYKRSNFINSELNKFPSVKRFYIISCVNREDFTFIFF